MRESVIPDLGMLRSVQGSGVLVKKGGAPRVTDEAEARARAAELGPLPSTGPDPGAAGAGIAPPAGPSRL